MLWIRVSKAIVAGSLGLWLLAVAYGNVIDYDVNFDFVRHVLGMTYVADDADVRWRAIEAPAAQHIAYLLIILTQFAIAFFFLVAAARMLARLRAPVLDFQKARPLVAIGFSLSVLLWLVGFQVIAGEWFQMWRSEDYNVQQSAFRFAIATFVGVIYIFQNNDGERSA